MVARYVLFTLILLLIGCNGQNGSEVIADKPADAAFCDEAASFALMAAVDRDKGNPISEIQSLIVRGVRGNQAKATLQDIVLNAYNNPSLSPGSLKEITWKSCMSSIP